MDNRELTYEKLIRTDRSVDLQVTLNGSVIPTHEFVTGAKISMGANSAFDATLELYDTSWRVIEDSLIVGAGTEQKNVARIKYGWAGMPLGDFEGNVYDYTFDYQPPMGVAITMQVAKSMLRNMKKITRSWPRGTCPHQVVEELAAESGFPVFVEKTKPFKKPLSIRDQDALSWIKEKFCDKGSDGVVSETGASGFVTGELEDGTLSFTSLEYHNKKHSTVKRDYVVAKDRQAQVISFKPRDNSTILAMLGGESLQTTGYDSSKGAVVTASVNRDGSNGFEKGRPANVTPGANYEPTITLPGRGADKRPLYRILGSNRSEEEVKTRLSQTYALMSAVSLTATLEIMGDPEIQLYDLVSVIVLRPDGSRHFLSGTFRVAGYEHTIGPGDFKTSMELIREGLPTDIRKFSRG